MAGSKEEKAIIKSYNSKRAKYKLPKLEDLQRDFKFPICNLEAEKNMVLLSLRGELSNILRSIIQDVEAIVSGSDRYCCNIERREFTKDDRKDLFETYVKLQQLYWEGRLAFLGDESAIADWIKKLCKEWKGDISKKLLWYTKKMNKSWIDIKRYETELKYVG